LKVPLEVQPAILAAAQLIPIRVIWEVINFCHQSKLMLEDFKIGQEILTLTELLTLVKMGQTLDRY
jgi:hypothetical protein